MQNDPAHELAYFSRVRAIDHWRVNLLQLPRDMLTVKGSGLAGKRAGFMLEFLAQLAREMGAAAPDDWDAPQT